MCRRIVFEIPNLRPNILSFFRPYGLAATDASFSIEERMVGAIWRDPVSAKLFGFSVNVGQIYEDPESLNTFNIMLLEIFTVYLFLFIVIIEKDFIKQ